MLNLYFLHDFPRAKFSLEYFCLRISCIHFSKLCKLLNKNPYGISICISTYMYFFYLLFLKTQTHRHTHTQSNRKRWKTYTEQQEINAPSSIPRINTAFKTKKLNKIIFSIQCKNYQCERFWEDFLGKQAWQKSIWMTIYNKIKTRELISVFTNTGWC